MRHRRAFGESHRSPPEMAGGAPSRPEAPLTRQGLQSARLPAGQAAHRPPQRLAPAAGAPDGPIATRQRASCSNRPARYAQRPGNPVEAGRSVVSACGTIGCASGDAAVVMVPLRRIDDQFCLPRRTITARGPQPRRESPLSGDHCRPARAVLLYSPVPAAAAEQARRTAGPAVKVA